MKKRLLREADWNARWIGTEDNPQDGNIRYVICGVCGALISSTLKDRHSQRCK